MASEILKRVLLFVLLCLIQALVLNGIHLFGYAIPLLFVYFVVQLPRHLSKSSILLWSFALGLSVDVFSNTPGLTAASLTLTGALQPYLLQLFLPRDAEERLSPSVHSLGFLPFLTFASLLVLFFCAAFFGLEAFNFYEVRQWLLTLGASTLLTLVLILALEPFRHSDKTDTRSGSASH